MPWLLIILLLLGGCLGRGDPAHLHELRVLDELRQINYQLERDRDTRHPVERYRPDIWRRMFPKSDPSGGSTR